MIGNQGAGEQLLLGHQVKRSTAMCGEDPRDSQFALRKRAAESRRCLNLDQSLAAIGHANQEVRHDVAAALTVLRAGTF